MQNLDVKKLQLSIAWLSYQGLKINPKNLKNVSFLSIEQLESLLAQRNIFITTIKH